MKKRNSLSLLQRELRSLRIKKRLAGLEIYKNAKVVMFFVTLGSEVRTKEMIEQAWKDKKEIAVPLADVKSCKLSAAAISSFKEHLRPGAYGILEPDTNVCPGVSAKRIDVVLVPAIAFDVFGHRIGYGKGYYDSWLANFPIRKRIGLAFDFQVLEKLPATEKDQKVKMIVTEKRVIETKKRETGNGRW